jgi:hypothetical protein
MISARFLIQVTLPLLMVALASQGACAGDGIVGTWHLVSVTTTITDTGEVTQPYGEHPDGRLTYTPGGRMTGILVAEGRKRLGPSAFSGSVEDQAEAYKTMISYAGSYTLTDTGVIHHVDVAWVASWVGVDQVRFTKLDGDTLTITTPPFPTPPDGKLSVITLVWKRSE